MVNIDTLRQVPLFADLSTEQLQWLAEQGTEVWLQPGEFHRREGDPAEHVFVMLAGEVRIAEQVGNQELVLATYGPKTLFGELPILMGTPYYWASGRALSPCYILELSKETFWQMLATMPIVATAILRTTAERVQELQSMAQQREKLIELGALAADLAHELNHPAVKLLQETKQLEEIMKELVSSALQPELQPATGPALQGERLLDEVEQNAAHISELVNVIKEYSYMDQAPLQEVNVHEGLNNTLKILRHKLKKGVVVTREFDHSLPSISAYGSELNQVWTNLIDNAIDALEESSEKVLNSESGDLAQKSSFKTKHSPTIWIRTQGENNSVLVEIADNGHGIPPEIQPRIFEPFFTTKGVGQGTGLGLVTSYRTIVGKHHGDIQIFSQPGDTRFRVRLPIAQVP